MKVQKHVEEQIQCDQCDKKISGNHAWWRINGREYSDFCSSQCAITFRDRVYDIRTVDYWDDHPVRMGNTD